MPLKTSTKGAIQSAPTAEFPSAPVIKTAKSTSEKSTVTAAAKASRGGGTRAAALKAGTPDSGASKARATVSKTAGVPKKSAPPTVAGAVIEAAPLTTSPVAPLGAALAASAAPVAPVAPAAVASKAAPAVASAPADASKSAAETLDPLVHAAIARLSSSMSGTSSFLAAADWALHLSTSPGKLLDLAKLAMQQSGELARYASASAAAAGNPSFLAGTANADSQQAAATPPAPPVKDRRFAGEPWQQFPYSVLHQSFLLNEQWWQAATRDVWGVEPHHEKQVEFGIRQMLDMFSPGNQLATNPVALQATIDEKGANLVRGARNALNDLARQFGGADKPASPEPGALAVGRELAVTPGKVVLKNQLIELLQYEPTTTTAYPEPILLVPAWIMKYYVLDLSQHNSLVKYLVDQGHTVFCISWKNPGVEERALGMDDYLQLGFHAALDAVNAIVPKRKVHAAGYCLGGTLLSIAAASMARDGDDRLASITLLAAQTDFTEPGELGLFIDEAQLSVLEAQMNDVGYLSGDQMAGAFQMLRANDLVWSRLIGQYMMGEHALSNDLMTWNADATRMPARMHSEYLRRLFLHNDLAAGRFLVGGKPIALSECTLPAFVVGTETDHVAPWHSVYKLHYQSVADLTFVLASGGHNAGIVSEPGHKHRHYRLLTRAAGTAYLAPAAWQAAAPELEGSWWPAWEQWLTTHSGQPVKPPQLGAPNYRPSADAPGSYVLER